MTYGPCSPRDGYKKGLESLGRSDRPDAIFVTSDGQARGVLRAADDLGIDVAADVAICSFDGTTGAAYSIPGITTIAQPVDHLGIAAVELSAATRRGPRQTGGAHGAAHHLIRRRSGGCPEDSGLGGASTPDSA